MIPEEEYKARVKALIPKLSKTMTADSSETRELFLLYNDRFTPQEHATHCGGCRQRVFKRLQKYYETIKDETTNQQ